MENDYYKSLTDFAEYLYQFMNEIDEFKNNLLPKYDSFALESLCEYYQGVTERLDNHWNYVNDPFFAIIRRSERRSLLTKEIADASQNIAREFEKYANGDESYSRTTIRRLLNNVLIRVRTLYDFCIDSGGIVQVKTKKELSENQALPISTDSTISPPQETEKSDANALRVFVCHSSNDKPLVKDLYQKLSGEKNIDPWFDEAKILAGQEWDFEIKKAIQEAHVIIVVLSKDSVKKEGYVQKEISEALDVAEEKPEGTIFIIPLRLEECEVPKRLSRWQWVNFYESEGYKNLMRSLQYRAITLRINL